MKLNFECIRDTLIVLEDTLQFDDELKYPYIIFESVVNDSRLQEYKESNIAYTLIKMEEAELIVASFQDAENSFTDCIICDITFSGHELLNNIRPKDNWAKLQSAIKKFGGVSVEVMQKLAPILLSSAIQDFIK